MYWTKLLTIKSAAAKKAAPHSCVTLGWATSTIRSGPLKQNKQLSFCAFFCHFSEVYCKFPLGLKEKLGHYDVYSWNLNLPIYLNQPQSYCLAISSNECICAQNMFLSFNVLFYFCMFYLYKFLWKPTKCSREILQLCGQYLWLWSRRCKAHRPVL